MIGNFRLNCFGEPPGSPILYFYKTFAIFKILDSITVLWSLNIYTRSSTFFKHAKLDGKNEASEREKHLKKPIISIVNVFNILIAFKIKTLPFTWTWYKWQCMHHCGAVNIVLSVLFSSNFGFANKVCKCSPNPIKKHISLDVNLFNRHIYDGIHGCH